MNSTKVKTSRKRCAFALLLIYCTALLISCGPPSGPHREGRSWLDRFDSSSQTLTAVAPSQLYDASVVLPTDSSDGKVTIGGSAGQFAVSNDGAATYTYPIWVPPGRGGVAPSLALTYSSRGGNGFLGVGWSLSGLSQIARCGTIVSLDGAAHAVDFSSADGLCLDGQRLLSVNGKQTGDDGAEYRTEVDSQTKVVYHASTNTFEVRHKNGRIQTYGVLPGTSTPGGLSGNAYRRSATGDSSIPVQYSWALTREQDRSGNYFDVTYSIFTQTDTKTSTSGQAITTTAYELLPVTISYTGSLTVGAPMLRSVTFGYQARSDPSFAYAGGLKLISQHVLTSITASGPGVSSSSISGAATPHPLRTYGISYTTPSITHRSLLTMIKECDGTGICKEPTTFTWERGCQKSAGISCDSNDSNASDYLDANYGLTVFSPSVIRHSVEAPQMQDLYAFEPADLNGDGFDDLLIRQPYAPDDNPSMVTKSKWNYLLSDGANFNPLQLVSTLLPETDYAAASNTRLATSLEDLIPIDMDGDGKPEIWRFNYRTPYSSTGQGYVLYAREHNTDPLTSPAFPYAYNVPQTYIDYETAPWWDSGQSPPLQFPQMHVADLNGDGFPEVARSTFVAQQKQWGVRQNQSSPGSVSLAAYTPLSINSGIDHAGYVADIDGSGRASLLIRTPASTIESLDAFSATYKVINTDINGSPLPARESFLFGGNRDPMAFAAPFSYYQHLLIDVNGDGLPDSVKYRQELVTPNGFREDGSLYVSQNIGGVFLEPYKVPLTGVAEISAAQAGIGQPYIDVGIRVLDYNGDGMTDILLLDNGTNLPAPIPRRSHPVVLLSNGSGFTPVELDIPVGDGMVPNGSNNHGNGFRMSQVLDVNGDGLPDIVQMVNNELHVYTRRGHKPDVITGISGSSTQPAICDVTYRAISDPASRYIDYAPAMENERRISRGMDVVTSYSYTDSTGNLSSFSFGYDDPRVAFRGRGWLGFGRRVVTDNRTGATFDTTYMPRGDLTNGSGLYDRPVGLGKPQLERIQIIDPTDSSKQRTIVRSYEYASVRNSSNDRILFEYPKKVTTTEYDAPIPPIKPGGNWTAVMLRQSASEIRSVDAYGNPTEQVATSYEIGGAGRTITSTTESSYYPADTDSWLVDLLQSVTTTSSIPSGWTTADIPTSGQRIISFEYDSNGRLQKIHREPSLSTNEHLDTELGLDAFGNLTSASTTGNGGRRTWTAVFDDLDHTFPATKTDEVGLTSTFLFHSGLGVLSAISDRDGLAVRYRYDGFGRRKGQDYIRRSVTSSGGLPSQTDIQTSYQGFEFPGDTRTYLQTLSTGIGGDRESEVFNPLGQVLRRSHNDFNSSGLINTDFTYNALGLVTHRSSPWSDSNPSVHGPDTIYSYDGLSRVKSITNADGSSRSYSYSGLSTSIVDELGHSSSVAPDSFGLETQRIEMQDDGPSATTTYWFGTFGQLAQVSDAASNSTVFKYDTAGRLVSEADPNYGTQGYAVDPWGDVIWHVNGRGQSIFFTRDNLGRIVDIRRPEGQAHFTWDSSPNGAGELAGSWFRRVGNSGNPDFAKSYTYDVNGALSTESLTNEVGEVFALTWQHDSSGRLSTLTYPLATGNLFAIKYNYKANGWLSSITNASTNQSIYQTSTQNEYNEPTREVFGNGVVTTRRYDSAGQLRYIGSLDVSNAPFQSLAYEYFPGGRLKARHDTLAHTSEDFQYDALSRLKQWSITEDCGQSAFAYLYDSVGNLKQKQLLQGPGASTTLSYDRTGGAGPHAVSAYSSGGVGGSYQYDADGNQTSSPDRFITFSSLNMPETITTAGGQEVISYLYGPEGERLLKQSSQGSTLYFGDLYERRSSGAAATHVFHVFNGNREVAQVEWNSNGSTTTGSTLYLHDDHIGSIESVSDDSGHVIEHRKYEPFGGRRSARNLALPAKLPLSEVKSGFTSHLAEDEAGLINMRGRMYDPATGRFLSPDPLNHFFGTSQNINKYSYVGNDPLNFTDPLGLEGTPDSGSQVLVQQGTTPAPPPDPNGNQQGETEVEVYGPRTPPPPPDPEDPIGIGGASPDSAWVGAQAADRNGVHMSGSGSNIGSAAIGANQNVDSGLRQRWLILVGDPGLGVHSVGRLEGGGNFIRFAHTLADGIAASGGSVDIKRISSVSEFIDAMMHGPPIDGGMIFIGHTAPGALFVGENPGRGTNFYHEDVQQISKTRLAGLATLTIYGCSAGKGDNSIAQALANQLNRVTEAYEETMVFSNDPNLYSLDGYPNPLGPLYMLPVSGSAKTFLPQQSPPSSTGEDRPPDVMQIP